MCTGSLFLPCEWLLALKRFWLLTAHSSALFFLLTAGMAGTSIWLALKNLTTIENLTKATKVWQFAVRLPPSAGPSRRPGKALTSEAAVSSSSQANKGSLPVGTIFTAHEAEGQPSYVILRTEPGENPYDLGALRNWKDIMGENVIDWFLPVRHSPCCNHDRADSAFTLGPVVEKMKREAKLTAADVPRSSRRRHRRQRSADDDYPSQQVEEQTGSSFNSDVRRQSKRRRHS